MMQGSSEGDVAAISHRSDHQAPLSAHILIPIDEPNTVGKVGMGSFLPIVKSGNSNFVWKHLFSCNLRRRRQLKPLDAVQQHNLVTGPVHAARCMLGNVPGPTCNIFECKAGQHKMRQKQHGMSHCV